MQHEQDVALTCRNWRGPEDMELRERGTPKQENSQAGNGLVGAGAGGMKVFWG
jgi:hypothetical protein